jgi:hypothetical protein
MSQTVIDLFRAWGTDGNLRVEAAADDDLEDVEVFVRHSLRRTKLQGKKKIHKSF